MAFKLGDEFMMMIGIVVLAMFIAFDIFKAYGRGAKWLPGNFLVFCGLSVQLLGYLDIQHVSSASRLKEHDLEVLIAKQLSIDSSRLVLLVFVGYLLPGLASAGGLWSNIAALSISLSSHIALELHAVQTYGSKQEEVVKGQSRIWLIAYYYVLLHSILELLFLFVWAIGNGRFIRDNLSSRIRLILSGSDNNEASSWETYKSEIFKCWMVARVCQPEYVLGRTKFSAGVGVVLTNCVGVFSAKVICLRSQLHGVFPLLTLQFIFIIFGWFVVMYRWHSQVLYFRHSKTLFNFQFNLFFVFFFHIFPYLILDNSPPLLIIPSLILCLILALCYVLIFLAFYVAISLYFCTCMFSLRLSGLILDSKFVEGLCRVQKKPRYGEEFSKYEPTLKRLCWPKEDPESLWVANESSFKEIKDGINKCYDRGGSCQELIMVIGSRPGGNYVERVQQLLEPLESVKEYFPLLKDSFRRITALSLLFIMNELMSGQDQRFISEKDKKFIEDANTAYEQAEKLIDLLDCPDTVGINVDILRTKNVEAFMVKPWEGAYYKIKFVDVLRTRNVQDTNPVEDAFDFIGKLRDVAKKELDESKLLEEVPNAEVLNTDWDTAVNDYGMYKVCKIILDGHRPDTLKNLMDELSCLFAELIARCVEDSPKILLSCTKRWAKKFNEDKITAAIEIAGFAWGVTDKAKESNEASASSPVADTAVDILEPDSP